MSTNVFVRDLDIADHARLDGRLRKERTCTELAGEGGRSRLVVLVAEVAARASLLERRPLAREARFPR